MDYYNSILDGKNRVVNPINRDIIIQENQLKDTAIAIIFKNCFNLNQ